MKWVKEHITYRRTSYVAFQPKNRKNRVVRGIIGGVLGFGIALVVTYIGHEVLKINSLLIVGSLLALVTLFLAFWYGINRLFVLAVIEFGRRIVDLTIAIGCRPAIHFAHGVHRGGLYFRADRFYPIPAAHKANPEDA